MKKTTINRQLLLESLAPSKSEALYIIICRIGDQNMTADKKNFRTYTFYLTNPYPQFYMFKYLFSVCNECSNVLIPYFFTPNSKYATVRHADYERIIFITQFYIRCIYIFSFIDQIK